MFYVSNIHTDWYGSSWICVVEATDQAEASKRAAEKFGVVKLGTIKAKGESEPLIFDANGVSQPIEILW